MGSPAFRHSSTWGTRAQVSVKTGARVGDSRALFERCARRNGKKVNRRRGSRTIISRNHSNGAAHQEVSNTADSGKGTLRDYCWLLIQQTDVVATTGRSSTLEDAARLGPEEEGEHLSPFKEKGLNVPEGAMWTRSTTLGQSDERIGVRSQESQRHFDRHRTPMMPDRALTVATEDCEGNLSTSSQRSQSSFLPIVAKTERNCWGHMLARAGRQLLSASCHTCQQGGFRPLAITSVLCEARRSLGAGSRLQARPHLSGSRTDRILPRPRRIAQVVIGDLTPPTESQTYVGANRPPEPLPCRAFSRARTDFVTPLGTMPISLDAQKSRGCALSKKGDANG